MARVVWLSGAAFALLSGGTALAADLPAYEPAPAASVPSFTWTGPYIGAQIGYDWFSSDNKAAGVSLNDKPDGFAVGGYAGFNYQLQNSPLVLGVEGDVNYSDAGARRGANVLGGPGGTRFRDDVNWTGAVRGRIGYAFDRFLVYGAGGLALADREVKARGGANGSDNTTAVGWTIGGGVEAALTDNVTARVEYRYSDFGADSFSVADTRLKSDLTDNRVMVGVGYKFSTGW